MVASPSFCAAGRFQALTDTVASLVSSGFGCLVVCLLSQQPQNLRRGAWLRFPWADQMLYKGALRENWRPLVGVLLVAAVPLFIGFWSGWRSTATEGLVVDSQDLAIGVIRSGRMYKHRLVVRNSGSRTVTVPRVRVSCACTRVSPSDFRLEAGEDIALELTLDPELLRRSLRDSRDGEFQIGIAFFSQGAEIPRQWILTGTLSIPVALSPRQLAFVGSNVATVGKRGPTLIAAAGLVRADYRLGLAADVKGYRVECVRDSQDPATWRVSVTPDARSEVGLFETAIWLAVKDVKGKMIGEWPLRVKGQVQDRVTVLPETVELFPVDDQPITERVIVRSNIEKPFRIREESGGHVRVRSDSNTLTLQHAVDLIFDIRWTTCRSTC